MTNHTALQPNYCSICALAGEDNGYRCSDPGHGIATGRVRPDDYLSIALLAAGRSADVESNLIAEINPRARFSNDEVGSLPCKSRSRLLTSIQMQIKNFPGSALAAICSSAILTSFKDTSDLQTQPLSR